MTFLSSCLSRVRRWQLLGLFLAMPFAASAGEMAAWVLVMQNPDAAQSIISTSKTEKDHLVQAGWKLNGAGVLSTEGGADKAQLFRMVRMTPNVARRLAIGSAEVAANIKEGYASEGPMGYVWMKERPGAVAVHRFSKGDRLIWVSGNDEQYWADHNGWKREPGTFWLKAIK